MTRREPSLFIRLIGLMSAILAFGGAVLMTAAWFSARQAADEAYDRLLLGAAFQIADAITIQDGTPTIELPVSAFELLSLSDRDRIFYSVTDPAGQAMTGYADLPAAVLGRLPAARNVTVGNASYRGETVRVAGVTRTFDDPQLRGEARVLVAQTTVARNALARQLTLRSLALVAIMGVIAIGGMVFAVRRALAPIGRLETAIRQRDPLDLTAIDTPAPRELAPFVAEINTFMAKLRGRIAQMQNFIGNTAHQLRTPIAALNSQVELLANGNVDAAGRARLKRIRERTAELARLTNQLLSHAMIVHRDKAVAAVRFDLVALTRRAVDEAVPDTERDILVTLYPPASPLLVDGDPVNVAEAIKNIIDNAVRHGAPSEIRIRLYERKGQATIEIEDDGPGIPAADWQRAVERFGLLSPEGGGSGLGLSIAAEVAAAHGGTMSFGADGELGFTVILTFRSTEEQATP